LLELPAFVGARSVGLFWPMEERAEVDVRALDQAAREGGKAVFYPYMDRVGDVFRTGFRSVSHPEELAPRGAGFAEPRPEAPTAMRGDIDLIVVPALAVSAAGHRIGYGRGYYDVTLPDFCPPAVSVAVAFSFQLLLELPHTENDVRCEFVVTDERTLDARSG
jgi:5-formyltetrahydrofolate cyclo-ligase